MEHPKDLIQQSMKKKEVIERSESAFLTTFCFPIQTARRVYGGLWLSLANAEQNRDKIIPEISNLVSQAAIALERSILLDEAVESGVNVDCEATPEMLETIFFPNNAIHDGGVVIRGDRIAKAACIFPMTQRQDLSKSLGTRHRAAIGLSEETDALLVVVSEETGRISVAFGGRLEPVPRENLSRRLAALLSAPGGYPVRKSA